MMHFILKRIGLFIYGTLSILESSINMLLYVTFLDTVVTPVDWAFPFYFKYVDQLLKGNYLSNLKDNHGKDI